MGAERVPLQGSYSLVVFLLDTVLLGLNKRGIGKEGGWGRRERRREGGGGGGRERRRDHERGREGRVEGEMMRKD